MTSINQGRGSYPRLVTIISLLSGSVLSLEVMIFFSNFISEGDISKRGCLSAEHKTCLERPGIFPKPLRVSGS